MSKVLISVLGSDQPGILSSVSKVIFEHQGNIENLSQTLLDQVFGALLQVDMPTSADCTALQSALQETGAAQKLFIGVYPWTGESSSWHQQPPPVQPYIVTVIGPDRLGMIAEVSDCLFRHGINITNLHASFTGGDRPLDSLMVFEIDIPKATVMNDLRTDLQTSANKLELEINLQHRKIFDSVSNILT